MSFLLPVSAPLPQNTQSRDPVAFANTAAQRPAPAVSATLTQTAVQQTKAGTRTEVLTTRDSVPVTDRRNRLVGPPPTFEVNLLQHLRETRNDPPEMVLPDSTGEDDGNDAPDDPSLPRTGNLKQQPDMTNTAYGQLSSHETPVSDAAKINARF